MKFAAIIEYNAVPETIAAIRPSHRQYLTKQLEEKRLAAAGPITDDSGALMIFEAASAEEVEATLRADPFNVNGVFKSWVIRPWKLVFTNSELLTPQV